MDVDADPGQPSFSSWIHDPEAERLNEATPLFPSVSEDLRNHGTLGEADGGHHHVIGGGSISSAVFNLSNTIIGAGIMGLPATFKALGIPLGLITLIFVGVVSEYSLQRLLRCSTAAKAWSFGDLMSETYGRGGRGIFRAIIIIHNIGILVVYLILIGDILSGSNDGAMHYPGLFEEWAGGPRWWNSRFAVLFASVLFAVGPLVSLQRIDSLKYSSFLSILLAVFFVAITIGVTVYNLFAGKINWGGLRWLPNVSTNGDVWHLFAVIPTMATAFTCHYNLHPILVEMAHPREEKMSVAMKTALALCTSVYCTTALFGYMLFGESTSSDVLANFDKDLGVPYSQALNDVVRLFYAIHILLVFPVVNYSLRATFDSIVFPHAPPLNESLPRFYLVTVVVVGGIFGLALTVPSIQFAFQFVGSTGAATLVLTFPGMIALSECAGAASASPKETFMAWFLFILGLVVTTTGLTNNVHSLF